jgi:hypothetical protein
LLGSCTETEIDKEEVVVSTRRGEGEVEVEADDEGREGTRSPERRRVKGTSDMG